MASDVTVINYVDNAESATLCFPVPCLNLCQRDLFAVLFTQTRELHSRSRTLISLIIMPTGLCIPDIQDS